MTMLTMRCRVLQNEFVEGQQEQQAAEVKMMSLQHALQLQQVQEQAAAERQAVCLKSDSAFQA